MRHLLLYILTMTFWTCKAQPSPEEVKATEEVESPASVIEIIYERQSRANRSVLTAKSETIELTNSTQKPKIASYSKSEWVQLVALVNTIPLKRMGALESPTNRRLFDGAPAASLSIKTTDQLWVSSTFDDGYPPQEIAELVYTLIAMEEALLKE